MAASVADVIPSSVNGENGVDGASVENDDHELKVRNIVTKQISLPPNFTFNVRPPSGEPPSIETNENVTPGTSLGIGKDKKIKKKTNTEITF